MESFGDSEDSKDLLLKASIASMIVYQDDPIKYLKTHDLQSVDHGIEEICFSQSHEDKQLKYFNKLSGIKYLVIKDEKKKNVYVSFRGTARFVRHF